MAKTNSSIISVLIIKDKDHEMTWKQVIFKISSKVKTTQSTTMLVEISIIKEEMIAVINKKTTYLLVKSKVMIFNNETNFMKIVVILTEDGFNRTSALYMVNSNNITIVTDMMTKDMTTCISEKWTKIDTMINTLAMLELTITDGKCLQKNNSMTGSIKGLGTNSKWTD